MQLDIRQADFSDSGDAAGIVDVLDSYASDPVGGGEPLTAEVRQCLVDQLQKHPTTMVLLAYDESQPVGIAVCFYGFSTFQARRLLNIHDLAVIPTHRGQGVGRALLTEAESQAVQNGCCKLTLEVQDSNTPARQLYERFGFTDYVVGDSAPTRFLSKPLAALDS